ncbi:hypothetical protein ILUMI_09614 [Ignelater luminosus]|uniref:DNA-directed RNA polymerase subunit n=1 Tax=Ignelater luminosus TaxID=2038154 RepID=A0A8K0GED0_IGNLU|nr:hypothetical protein ILUMI_09614 [Ignelater luminosus]
MARRFNRNDIMHPKHLVPEKIAFSVFSSEDIKSLSVIKIYTPLTFDALGHPLPGGLYDKCLGPLTDRSEPCGTCFKNMYFCPGHFGYIELPLPVVNPVFHKTVASILKITCLSCYNIQMPNHVKYCLSIQMKLLNHGLITDAVDIETTFQSLGAENKNLENFPEDALASIKELEMRVENDEVNAAEKLIVNKNIEAMRAEFIDSKLKALTSRKTCMHCRQPLDRIQTLKNRIIISTSRSKKEADVSQSILSKSVRASDSRLYLNPEESRKHMQKVWENESDFLGHLVPVLRYVNCKHPTDIFYFEIIPVTPSNMRPVNVVGGRMVEHEQTQLYKNILQNGMLLRTIIQVVQNDGDINVLPVEAKGMYSLTQGKTPIEKLNNTWEALQLSVDGLVDKDVGGRNAIGLGLKQIIEKKAGLIRMHMMGKRVNFSARSVITPDPNLNIEEIGIPEEFAKSLTYPVPVTSWNVTELRKMIMNGPNVHPGAVQVEYEDGSITRINSNDKTQQKSIIKRLLTPYDKEKGFTGVKMVHRHLCNGDILLLNRQPTLHKPSIMAHTARILKGEKTLRLHYANCKAYNADFDGDEMNAHFPQNELARSEGYTLAHVCNQYLVPKDGTPLSGLIQDHIISGVRLSIRGQFFSKNDYQQLVFQALTHKTTEITLLPPTIIKPVCLWSGKQVLSTVIINIIPPGRHPINLTSSSKIKAKEWQTEQARPWKAGGTSFTDDNVMSEAEVIIKNGELLCGVLDKTHYGATPYGLVHCMYEVCGLVNYCMVVVMQQNFLAHLQNCLHIFLQCEGFTLGVRDILVLEKADKKRKKIIKSSRKIGTSVMTAALDIPDDTDIKEIVEKIEEATFRNPKMRSIIDRQYKSELDSYTNDINRTCLPAGLICKFPSNNLQLMVQSGAKGTTVNTTQISCLLGQIELEGKRPPVMISGKSLPSFPIFEFAPRAGGFIDGRFMTGIQPQEFFFHCMAGREGLIDTAVKTSRSGYLQRCLIKHLEGLTVNYDLTVRDSDRSVIQFYYGEDGMDVSKAQFLNSKHIRFLAENSKAIIDKSIIKDLQNADEKIRVEDSIIKLGKWKNQYGNPLEKRRVSPFTLFSGYVKGKLVTNIPKKQNIKNGRSKLTRQMIELWRSAEEDIHESFKMKCQNCPDPVNSILQPDIYYGALTDHLATLMENYQGCKKKKQRKEFESMIKFKAMQSLCAPGEPVGLLAAQSIGEPSTQMTLNTFHFAGRGEMNVTLGIPRLREILMMASKTLKTPSIEIPFRNVPNLEKEAERLKKILTRVTVADILEKIDVYGKLETGNYRQMVYTVKFCFLPHHYYKSKYNVKAKQVLKHMTKDFFKQMFMTIRKYTKVNTNTVIIEKDKEDNGGQSRGNVDKDDEDDVVDAADKTRLTANEDSDNSDDEPEDTEDAKLTSKFNQAHDDQEPEEEEKEASDNEDNIYGNNKNINDEKNQADNDAEDSEAETSKVVNAYTYAQNYKYDSKAYLWCEIIFALPLTQKKLDLTAILKEVAHKSVIWETPNIKRAITYMKDDRLTLRTDGINIIEMFKYNELLDLNKLYSNDIHKVAETYGIEAAAKVIVKEVQEVFKVYGITVDPRHLLLIADYMTFNGKFEPLNRTGISSSASPFQQMSFEASLNFLKTATIQGKQDQLQNPSGCLIIGKPCNMGTGSFTLKQKIVK